MGRWRMGETTAASLPRTASKYHLATFGCQMNEYDSNLIGTMLEQRGLSHTEDPAQADVLIVNTCSIRGGAEERAYARIASMRHYKRVRPGVRIAVVGCMAQNHGERISESLEHVDYVVGPDNYGKLEGLLFPPSSSPLLPEAGDRLPLPMPTIPRASQGLRKAESRMRKPVVLTEQDDFENYSGLTARLDGSTAAHITIMRGCNKQCAYCIVPTVRGKERSRDVEDILAEVRHAVRAGVREVCLLGQTVNSYRTPEVSFAGLLWRLNAVDGLWRIRFTSPHPRHFDADTIRALAECDKVCNHVHLPLQSGSDAMLRKMRRQYSARQYLDIVSALRTAVPDLALTTDIITGFVGESENDFAATVEMMRLVRFDHAFMFSYSPRLGTPAAAEAETLSAAEKQQRLEQVIELQMGITEEILDAHIGREVEVLLEDRSARNAAEWVGKTRNFKKVVVPQAPGLGQGTLVNVRITARSGIILRGQLIKDSV